MTISPNAMTVWRNYETDGVPSSGNYLVEKSAERTWGTAVEAAIDAYSSGAGSIAKSTRALLYADLVPAAGVTAWVYADSTVAYNGIYVKVGGTGTGSWTRILDLPYDVIIATDAGAGTANAIVATSSLTVSESALILLNVFEANTATPVTVAFNGGSALTIKTAAGNNVSVGGLVAGMALLGKITGSTFRMVSDQASAAIQAAAEAAQAAAEAAQAAAEAAAPMTPESQGAIANGTADDKVSLQAALDTGKKVYLTPGKTYAFGSQLTIPSGGGFYGGGKLKMLTGTGKFDAADYTGGTATNKVGILISSKTDVTVEAVIEMEANAGIRTCSAIFVLSSPGTRLDVECFGFKEAHYGIIEWNSSADGYIRGNVHDCNSDSVTLPSAQITALAIDSNRSGPAANSQRVIFDMIVNNVLHGPAAAAVYGYQSDAVNIGSQGYSGITGRIVADTVGEAIDCFGDGNIIDVTAQNVYEYGVKLIHGAENNVIRAAIDNTGRAAVVLGGSNTSTKTVSHNRIYATARRVGELRGLTGIAAVATDGTSATYKPEKNYVEITAFGNGTAMDFVVYEDSGSNNVFIADGDGWDATNGHFGHITGSAGTGANRSTIRRQRGTHVRANIGTATTITAGSTVPYDTETVDTTGEYDSGAYTFTARCAGRYRVRATVRSGGIATLQSIGLSIFRGGTEIARNQAFNYAGTTQEAWSQVEAIVDMDAGQTILISGIYSAGGSVAVTNIAAYSYLEIDQL